MAVSVVIPTWRRVPWLDRCLAAVAAQSRPPDAVLAVRRAGDEAARALVERRARNAQFCLPGVEVSRPGHLPQNAQIARWT